MNKKEFYKKIGKDYDNPFTAGISSSKSLEMDTPVKTQAEIDEEATEKFKIITTQNVWGKRGDSYIPIEETVNALPSDFYDVYLTMSGVVFEKKPFENDVLIDLPDSECESTVNHCKEFWELGETFKSLGFLHKRGILLYGIPGSSKSVTAFKTGDFINKSGGVTLYPSSPGSAIVGLKAFRNMDKKRQVIVILEDIDEIISCYGDKSLTALLDGEDKIDNVLFLATTNYISRLPKRIVSRPSRFDVIQEMQLPTEAARKEYLKHKASALSEEQLEMWAKSTDKFTIPMLKELVILVLAYAKPLADSIESIKSSFEYNQF